MSPRQTPATIDFDRQLSEWAAWFWAGVAAGAILFFVFANAWFALPLACIVTYLLRRCLADAAFFRETLIAELGSGEVPA